MTDFINRLEHEVFLNYQAQTIRVALHDPKTGDVYSFKYNLRDAQSMCDWPSAVGPYYVKMARSSLAQMWGPQP